MMKFTAASLLLSALCGLLLADESSFEATPDAFWTRFDPTYQAGFDFSNSSARLT